MTRKAIIQTLECCSANPSKCGDCPLCGTTNCMNVSRREAMQALKNSTEAREAHWVEGDYGESLKLACSSCGSPFEYRTTFCPDCGANMDEEVSEG